MSYSEQHNTQATLDYAGAEKYVIDRLRHELPETIYYHGIRHTRETIMAAEEFSSAMAIAGEDLVLLKTAALYHDAGYIETSVDHEIAGARIAEETLGGFGYLPKQIVFICRLIKATACPHKPADRFEEIICDADLEYLGSSRYYEYARLLRRELAAMHGNEFSEPEWLDFQIGFIRQHRFFTAICRETREPFKQRHLQELIKLRRLYR